MDKPCENRIPELSAYLDGELSSSEEQELLDHLAHCQSCSALLESYRAVTSDLYLQSPSPGFTDRVMARVKQDRRKKIIPFRSATLVAAAVALVLLGASGTFGTLLHRMGIEIGSNKSYSTAEAAAQMDQTAENSVTFGSAPAAFAEHGVEASGEQSAAAVPAEDGAQPKLTAEAPAQAAEPYSAGSGSDAMAAMLAPADDAPDQSGSESRAQTRQEVPATEAAPESTASETAAEGTAAPSQAPEPAPADAPFTAQAFAAPGGETTTEVTFTAMITGVEAQDGQMSINVRPDSDVGIAETDEIAVDTAVAGQEDLKVGDRVSVTVNISGLGESQLLEATNIQAADDGAAATETPASQAVNPENDGSETGTGN